MKDSIKDCVVYQIYPKSFKDSNNDGIGDLKGIIEKLDYIKLLGIDYIWLTPFYVSPQNDNGYDIADYYNIDFRYGTMEDFELLVEESSKRNIKLMLDLVFNHTSTEHIWFKKALLGNKKYKDYYIFKHGDKSKPPTNWQSKFGGSAWEYVEQLGEYYLHLFDVTQADLNWNNEQLRQEIYDVVNFWIEKGVKGFRLDVINLISKPEFFEDDIDGDGRRFYTDGVNIHKYLKELNENTFGKNDDIITVGEMSSTSIDNCIKYSNEAEKELSMVFNFHHLKVDYKDGEKWSLMDFDFIMLKKIFDEWQTGMYNGKGWGALFWCNHDQPRINSRFTDTKHYHYEASTMLALSIHFMSGTPYIYQGEEFGMCNPEFDKIESYRDIESLNYYNILEKKGMDKNYILDILKSKSRDNSRTPVQWNNNTYAGFSDVEPWIPVSKDYNEINAQKAIEDYNSIFYFYKKLIEIRKEEYAIINGDYEIIFENDIKIYAYKRCFANQTIIVVCNFYNTEHEIDLSEYADINNINILISNYKFEYTDLKCLKLAPYQAFAFKYYS